MTAYRAWLTGLALASAPAAALAQAGPAPIDVSGVLVVAPTPLGGGGVDADKLPGVVETVGGQDFVRTGSLAVTDALEQRVPGLSLSDAQGNALTRDVNFRGFQASPLQGTPQGLAVYMNGVRLNEAFGDTVNWDLIPEVAIRRADLFTSNPAFGLNALGGAVALRMKSGFDTEGGDASLQAGSFGRVFASGEFAAGQGPWGVYLAADGGQDDGWRLHSGSHAARLFGDLGWRQGEAELHLSVAGARNRLGVVGPTPIDMVREDHRSVYTWPQTSLNKTGLVSLNGRAGLTGGWSLQGAAYLRRFSQSHVDGNDGDFEGCSGNAANPLYNTLCLEDDDFPDALDLPASAFQVQTLGGAPIVCPPLESGQTQPCAGVPYGSIDRTWTLGRTWGGSFEVSNHTRLWGRDNVFAAGASLDRSRVRFSADSTLGVIQPDLQVTADPDVPGAGQLIRTAGQIAYSPVEVRSTRRDLGVYATDTLDLTSTLSLTASGRFNQARIATTDLTGLSPDLNGRHRFSGFNPALGLAWRTGAGATLYGGYSQANRAPTPLELSCSDPMRPCLLENALVADPPLKQVVAHTWEGGLRGAREAGEGRLNWRVGVFQSDNHDDIVALASVIQGRGYYANVPKTRRRGLEASLDYVAGRWSGYAGYSHIDATYRFEGELPSASSPFADDGLIEVEPSDRIGGIPAERFKIGGDSRLSQRLVGDETGDDHRLGGYWTLALHASWQVAGRVELFGRVENLLGRRYAAYGTYFETDALEDLDPSPLPDDPDPRSVTAGQPRSFMIGLRASW